MRVCGMFNISVNFVSVCKIFLLILLLRIQLFVPWCFFLALRLVICSGGICIGTVEKELSFRALHLVICSGGMIEALSGKEYTAMIKELEKFGLDFELTEGQAQQALEDEQWPEDAEVRRIVALSRDVCECRFCEQRFCVICASMRVVFPFNHVLRPSSRQARIRQGQDPFGGDSSCKDARPVDPAPV